MSRIERLQQSLADLAAADEEDIPLGRNFARREMIVQNAVEAADELLCEFFESNDELALLTAQAAAKLMDKVLIPLQARVLSQDLRQQLDGITMVRNAAMENGIG